VAQPRPTVFEDRRRRPEQAPDQAQDSQQLVSLVTQKRGQRALESPPEPRPSRTEIPDIQKREALKLKFDLALGELSAYEASEAMLGNSDKLRFQLGPSTPPIEPAPEAGEEGPHEQSVAMLQRPSLDKLDMVQGAPANDHIEDVVSGPETLLNSREFKYATFFNRVKRGVSQQWSPRVAEEYLRRDPYGNIYGIRDRHTVISVALDVDGKLSEISVQRSSGVQFFDDVAVQSFQQASPFHNPPRSLADPDGMIRFQFGFYFQIGERPIIRALRFDSRDF
jgi:TonB family protein